MRNYSMHIALVALLAGNSMAIPWPVGDTQDEQDMTHTIMNNYGDYHTPWSHVCEDSVNFHFGTDFDFPLPVDGYEESENVWSVEAGEVTFVHSKIHNPGPTQVTEYTIVVCEDEFAEEGWCYQHIEPISIDEEWEVGDPIYFGVAPIATMAELHEVDEMYKHLHLMRTLAVYDHNNPGLLNPLAYFDPAPEDPDFTWEYLLQTGPEDIRYFFLPNVDAVDPENQMTGGWLEEWPDLADAQAAMFTDIYGSDDIVDISGEVDFFEYLYGSGIGDEGGTNQFSIISRKMNWTLFFWDSGASDWVPVQEPDESDFTRYVFDFEDIPLGGSDDWDKYKQLYFAYQPNELFGENGTTVCLTNCSDAEDWDGINTIEENCWDTALEAEGVNPSYHPLNMVTSDGLYMATVWAFDWEEYEAAEHSMEFMLHNTKEIAQEVHLTDAVTDQDVWHAEWVATYDTDGFTPEKDIFTNATAQPGATLDIEIIFSGPMRDDLTPFVRFSKPEGDPLIAEPAVVEWTSTYLPDGYVDTWHGTVDIPEEGYSGWMTMKIKAKDISDIGLLDPSIADPDPPSGPSDEEYTDEHHGFGMAFSEENGWPVTLEDNVYGSPVLADLDDDGDLDVAIQCANGWVELLDDDGSSFTGWPKISGVWGFINVYASPTLADLNEDDELDLLSVHDWGCHARDVSSASSLQGWPVYMGNVQIPGKYPSHSAPTIGDVDEDGDLEVVICRQISVSTTLEPTVYLFEHTGGLHTWCKNLEPTSGGASVIITAAIGDVTNNDGLEIIVCTAEGFATYDEEGQRSFDSGVYLLSSTGSIIWEEPFNTYFYASPVVADIDDDETNEIIVGAAGGTSTESIFVLNGILGSVEHTWSVGGWVMGPVGICDLNDDGTLDVVAAVNGGMVHCWSGESFEYGDQYDPLPGFPVSIGSNPSKGVSIADIDGDLELEIVVGSNSGVYALNADGTLCAGFPIETGVNVDGQVAIGEMDGDGNLEMVFADASTATAYCYDLGDGSFPVQMPWRQFQHDSWHTGFFTGDNTIPAPPTNLTGEQRTDGTVDLEWVLSVNDFYSPTPEEPTDVVFYQVWRDFPGFTPLSIIGRTHAGDGDYTDVYDNPFGYPIVRYMVTTHDGTNESEFSNDVRFHAQRLDVISLGCSVREEFCSAETSQRLPRETASIESDPGISEETAWITSRTGNPRCLTDGQTDEVYRPSSDASAVVMDLGEECFVSAVIPDGTPRASLDESVLVVDRTTAMPIHAMEVAGDDGEYEPFDIVRCEGLQGVRYIRITGAVGMSEISVYGSRPGEETCMAIEISRSSSTEGWMIRIPVSDRSSEAEVRIFDLAGRIVWDGNAVPGTTLHWDGLTGAGDAAPNGIYLVQCSIGEEITTGKLVVRQCP